MVWRFDAFSGNTALITEDGSEISYAELSRNCSLIADHIPQRSLVFCLCTNTAESIIGYVAFLQNSIVPLMLDAHMDKELLDTLIKTYCPDYLWIPSALAGEHDGCCELEFGGYSLLRTQYDHKYPLNDELCMLLTTSGSTGSPKLVRQSYRNLISNIESIVEYLEITSDDRAITMLPMSYTYGLSIINTHLWAGGAIIVTEAPIMQKRFWELLKQHRATSVNGVPYTYNMLNRLRFFNMELPYLRYFTQAGGKLSPELHQKCAEYAQKNGRRFYVMYGQTEASPRMGYLPYQLAAEKCGCMGIAIPGGKFSLIGTDGTEITEPDTVGELVYEGENVTLGYAVCGENLVLGDERHGVLKTGDMAKFDSSGIYTIVGRQKRFLKVVGKRINMDEIEALVKDEFENLWCACAGKDEHIFVFITDESLLNEVKQYLSHKTGLNPTAFHMVYLPEIPKNESGKTTYKALEKYYADT